MLLTFNEEIWHVCTLFDINVAFFGGGSLHQKWHHPSLFPNDATEIPLNMIIEMKIFSNFTCNTLLFFNLFHAEE